MFLLLVLREGTGFGPKMASHPESHPFLVQEKDCTLVHIHLFEHSVFTIVSILCLLDCVAPSMVCLLWVSVLNGARECCFFSIETVLTWEKVSDMLVFVIIHEVNGWSVKLKC